MTSRQQLTSALAAGVLALALTACGGDGDEASTPTTSGAASGPTPSGATGATIDQIEVKGFSFKPEKATVKAGTKLTWTFQDDSDHNVDPVGGAEPTKSQDLKNGGTYSFTFTKPGLVMYRCGIHNSMTGTVMITA